MVSYHSSDIAKHVLMEVKVNELSTTIDLESTLVRAEALFRRFQRTVEAIDKKSNFPAPKLRHRPTANASLGGAQSLRPTSPTSPPATGISKASTSGVDTISAGNTNSGNTGATKSPTTKPVDKDTAKGKGTENNRRRSAELETQRPKVISSELRELLSTKVEVLPRKVVRKEGEGLSSLKKTKS